MTYLLVDVIDQSAIQLFQTVWGIIGSLLSSKKPFVPLLHQGNNFPERAKCKLSGTKCYTIMDDSGVLGPFYIRERGCCKTAGWLEYIYHTLNIWLGIQLGQRYGHIVDRKQKLIVNIIALDGL